MGMSPMHYLNYQRIEKAKDFLLSNSMTISNISRLVGFDDPLYFSRVFKKYTGASPQAYYQNLGNTNTPDWFLNKMCIRDSLYAENDAISFITKSSHHFLHSLNLCTYFNVS